MSKWYAAYAAVMGLACFVLIAMGELLLAGFAAVHLVYGITKATEGDAP